MGGGCGIYAIHAYNTVNLTISSNSINGWKFSESYPQLAIQTPEDILCLPYPKREWFVGIWVTRGDGCVIDTNTIHDEDIGIIVGRSQNVSISHNAVKYTDVGVYAASLNTTTFSNNELSYYDWVGLYLYKSNQTNLTDNQLKYGKIGIYYHKSINTNTSNNYLENVYDRVRHPEGYQRP